MTSNNPASSTRRLSQMSNAKGSSKYFTIRNEDFFSLMLQKMKSVYLLSAPDDVKKEYTSVYTYSIATFINALYFSIFIAFSVLTIESMKTAKYILVEKSSSYTCTSIKKNIVGSYYLDSRKTVWTVSPGPNTLFSINFQNIKYSNEEFTTLIDRAYYDHFKYYQINYITSFVDTLPFIMAGGYCSTDGSGGIQIIRTTADPYYFFNTIYFGQPCGNLLANDSLYLFKNTSFDSSINRVVFEPSDNFDIFWYDSITQLSDGKNSIDMSYFFSVFAINSGLIYNYQEVAESYGSGYEYIYDGEVYTSTKYIDTKFPSVSSTFVCISVPRDICILQDFYSKRTDDEQYHLFAATIMNDLSMFVQFPFPVNDTGSIESSISGITFGLVFYKNFQDAVDGILQFDSYKDYNDNLVEYVDGADGNDGVFMKQNANTNLNYCGNCTNVLLITGLWLGGPLNFNGLNIKTQANKVGSSLWIDFVSTNPPTQLQENYYECQMRLFPLIAQGFGVAISNTAVSVALILVVVLPLIHVILGYFNVGRKVVSGYDIDHMSKKWALALMHAEEGNLSDIEHDFMSKLLDVMDQAHSD